MKLQDKLANDKEKTAATHSFKIIVAKAISGLFPH